MADPKIVDRLVSQLTAKGMSAAEAHAVAISHLQKSGVLQKGSNALTDKGQVRNAMSAADRAKDRASRYSGGLHAPSSYGYNPKTNLATLKEPKGHAVKVSKERRTPVKR